MMDVIFLVKYYNKLLKSFLLQLFVLVVFFDLTAFEPRTLYWGKNNATASKGSR